MKNSNFINAEEARTIVCVTIQETTDNLLNLLKPEIEKAASKGFSQLRVSTKDTNNSEFVEKFFSLLHHMQQYNHARIFSSLQTTLALFGYLCKKEENSPDDILVVISWEMSSEIAETNTTSSKYDVEKIEPRFDDSSEVKEEDSEEK